MTKGSVEPKSEGIVDGQRKIDLKVMLAHKHCSFCKKNLLLRYIVKMEECGYASVFFVYYSNNCTNSSWPTKLHFSSHARWAYVK